MLHSRLSRAAARRASWLCLSSACLHSAQGSSCDATATLSIASIKGGRDYMEDEYFVSETDKFKLLAVYDGHGGKDVSKYMKKHFYQAFVEASASDSSDNKKNNSNNSNSFVKSALKKALHSVDQDILTGPVSKSLHYQGCTSCMVYLDKLAAGSSSSLTSSVLSANVGDSRAVLARGVKAVDLTEDHKPNLPSERDRVESLGGVVSWHGRRDKAGNPIESTGVYRVNRNLALSRSMGDRYMRPYVTSEPDFVSVDITPEDEFIVVATDGLWDVISSQECVTIVQKIMQEYSQVPSEVQRFSAADKEQFAVLHAAKIKDIQKQMASILTSLALRRGSTDNITILVQWLK